ncbi:MAG TPA: hypothetical protein VF765_15365 [Polyangiaceae bacterium]
MSGRAEIRWPVCALRGHIHQMRENTEPARTTGRDLRGASGALALVVAISLSVFTLAPATPANAGSYPMHQCAPEVPAVSPGWSTYGFTTLASTVLSNGCSSGGDIGDYVYTDGQAGAVTENGSSGSQVGLHLLVPASAPDVSIASVQAQVRASSVTGDDAFLGFASAGQSLPGLVELPYGGGDYSTEESWTLPQGARDFEAFVNCTTDRSSPTCLFTDSTAVPALSDLTLTLVDSTVPSVSSASGPLASAAAQEASVSGFQAISFTATDADSGVRSATLTLSPQAGGPPSIHTFDFSSTCAYDSWSACPTTQTVSGFALETATLDDGTYAVELTIADAAGNTTNDALGAVTVTNSQATTTPLGAPPGPGVEPPAHVAPGTPGTPNGSGASETAELRLGTAATITRPYAQRALRLSGRLLSREGVPIGDATLALLQQVAGSQRQEVLANVSTGADGTFTVAVPPGPSRTIAVAYRAFSNAAGYAAQASVKELVSAGVSLRVTPRRIGPEGKIELVGTVGGPIPSRGAIVDLLVHYHGRWEPFRTPRTNARGQFKVAYQFQGAVGRFPFKAEVPEGQAGFPFSGGTSSVVSVATH